MSKYIIRLLISVSVLINVILGGNSNQTFSARNWERKRNNKLHLVWLIDKLFFWDKNHCLTSWSYWVTAKRANSKKAK